MARFSKGQSGNPQGKPLGAKSEKAIFWDEMKDWFMGEGVEKFKKELLKLDGRDYVQAYSNALEFFKPKLARTELVHEGEITTTAVIEGVEPPDEIPNK